MYAQDSLQSLGQSSQLGKAMQNTPGPQVVYGVQSAIKRLHAQSADLVQLSDAIRAAIGIQNPEQGAARPTSGTLSDLIDAASERLAVAAEDLRTALQHLNG